ncbi:MAG: response regulator transcription factor [Acidimicrobiia bacterium]
MPGRDGRDGNPRILVVEDDDTVREEVAAALRDAGFSVQAEVDGTGVDHAVATFRPDLVLLDVGLPNGPDGMAVARKIRAVDSVPFIFVTSAGAEEQRLRGFDLGADDYVVKPVSVPELVARSRAVLRRANRLGRAVWKVGDLVVDEEAHTVTMREEPVELTALEFSILAYLCRTPGRVVSKVQLLTEVWGFDHYALNVVEVHVSALRRKLEAKGPRVVHTVRNVGYVVRA